MAKTLHAANVMPAPLTPYSTGDAKADAAKLARADFSKVWAHCGD